MTKLTALDKKTIIDLYTNNVVGTSELAKRFNVHKTTILNMLKSNSITINPRRLRKRIDEQNILCLYNSGISISKIAKNMKVSHGPIKYILDANNIDIRRFPATLNISTKHDYFSYYNEGSSYWAGFIAADGAVLGNCLSICLKSSDIKHLEKMREVLNIVSPITTKPNGFSRSGSKLFRSILRIRSNDIVSDLKKNFSIVERKSLILQPPINIPNNCIRHYIRGYFDGDGHIGRNRKCIELCSGSKDILEWCLNFVKNNIKTSVLVKKRKNKNLYRFSFYGDTALKFLCLIYANSNYYLDRKRKKYISYLEEI